MNHISAVNHHTWTVFAGGTLHTRVQFPAEAVLLTLLSLIFLSRLFLLSTSFASLIYV
jgi:hypothetical protein